MNDRHTEFLQRMRSVLKYESDIDSKKTFEEEREEISDFQAELEMKCNELFGNLDYEPDE